MKKTTAWLILGAFLVVPAGAHADDDESRADKIIEWLFGGGDDDDETIPELDDAKSHGVGRGDGPAKKKRVRVRGIAGGDFGGDDGYGDGEGPNGPSPAVPEPSAAIAFGLGALLLSRAARRRRG